jgi:hypothetical protein
MQDLNLFAKTLLLEAGFEPDQIFDDTIEEMVDVIMDRLFTEIALELDDDDKHIFLELLETNETADSGRGFAQMKIENFDEFVIKVLEDFRKEYLENPEEI